MCKDKLLRVAIVGFGFMGRMHYGIWKRMKDVKVVGLCDKDRSQFTTKFLDGNIAGADNSLDFGDIPIYEDLEKMFAETKPDVISLTLPTFLHLPLAKLALQFGVSVLCEKPMALDSASCREMLDAARKAPNGAKLMIAQCVRFWPAFAYIKTLINEKKYGKLLSASFRRLSPPRLGKGGNWFNDEKRSGGLALDLHIHDADLIHFLFGMPKSVSSHATYHEDGSLQYISTLYDVGNVTVTAEGSWFVSPSAGFEASYTLLFEKATVILDGKREKPFAVFPFEGDAFVPKILPENGYYYEIEWFKDLLLGKEVPLITSPEESMDSVRLIEAELRSAKQGEVIEIEGRENERV